MVDETDRTPKTPEEATTPPSSEQAPPPETAPPSPPDHDDSVDALLEDDNDRMAERLDRLGGEPAPAISPQEFARLQQSGQIHIDSRGRIRTARREKTEAGMSLRKRRAWYK